MKRRLLNPLTVLLLLSFVAICLLWTRSYFVQDSWCWRADSSATAWHVMSRRGTLWVARFDRFPLRVPPAHHSGPPDAGSLVKASGGAGGRDLLITRVHVGVGAPLPPLPPTPAAVPYRFFGLRYHWLAAAAALPAAARGAARAVRRRTIRRRRASRACVACGYDLTGNESGVCPECGTPAIRRGDAARPPAPPAAGAGD